VSADGIHASAVVDAKSQIGRGVGIGAYSVIGPEVVLEDGVEIGHHVVLEGRVTVGPRTRIGHGSIVGTAPQDLKFTDGTPSGVRIGADTTLREYVTVHRASHDGEWTSIGNHCLLMTMTHVAHDCQLGDGVIMINYSGLTGHVHVGERVTIGGYSGGVPFTRMGAFAYVGGLTKVTADVPLYCMVDGNPATAYAVNVIGLRRAGVSGEDRRIIKAAFRILYRSGLTSPRALERIRAEVPATPYVQRLIEFLETARRGICGASEPRGHAVPLGVAPGGVASTPGDDDEEEA
jgi:UDP-N-acetylglucosamine acyltransferase